jgi:hypothetical protein
VEKGSTTLERPTELKRQLQASLVAAQQVWTVGEFVTALLVQASWNEPLDSVEFGVSSLATRRVTVSRDDDGLVVREGIYGAR